MPASYPFPSGTQRVKWPVWSGSPDSSDLLRGGDPAFHQPRRPSSRWLHPGPVVVGKGEMRLCGGNGQPRPGATSWPRGWSARCISAFPTSRLRKVQTIVPKGGWAWAGGAHKGWSLAPVLSERGQGPVSVSGGGKPTFLRGTSRVDRLSPKTLRPRQRHLNAGRSSQWTGEALVFVLNRQSEIGNRKSETGLSPPPPGDARRGGSGPRGRRRRRRGRR
jgi:hypothetical protein